MTRQEAWELLCEWTPSDSIRKHCLAVEAAVRWYARQGGEDEELWGLAGLLHDYDYERHQTGPAHPMEGVRLLRERGVDERVCHAILAHASYSGVPRESTLDHTLFACDELAGFITAVTYVRPNRSLAEVEVSSVKKKLKDKAFARAVSREDITQGAGELGLDLDTHIGNVIAALREVAPELGLAGAKA
jgi:putative nucleotidyltransferase with HDIG domain